MQTEHGKLIISQLDKNGTKQLLRHCLTIYNSNMKISLFTYS